jgi:hypothetical protein
MVLRKYLLFRLGDVDDKLSAFAYLSVMLGTITILLLDGITIHFMVTLPVLIDTSRAFKSAAHCTIGCVLSRGRAGCHKSCVSLVHCDH